MDSIYVALDLEFSGLDPLHDDIIEIGLVKFRGHEVLETFSSLVNPHRTIPLKILQLTGISQAEIDEAPTLNSLSGRILSFVANYPVVVHGTEMDQRLLSRQGLLSDNLFLDTFELSTILLPEAKRYTLSNLAAILGINLTQNHRALADALATKDLFLALIERASQWDPETLEELLRLSEASGWPLRTFFRDVASQKRDRLEALVPSRRLEPKMRIPFTPDEDLPPLEPKASLSPIDGQALAAMISPGGIIAKSFPGYEHRPQQIEMLRAVVEAFNTPAHLLVEAGTGTGKSMAYLLPAIYFAVENGRRVVISSNTINLQDQLVHKDIPDLKRILPLDFRVALLKGRNNYLCLRRLMALRRSQRLSVDEARLLAKVLGWLPVTKTGDRSELLMMNADAAAWARIQSDASNCLGDRCPFRQTGACFFYRARARAERAHLVIVNHALLLADLSLENRVLPEYKYLIIDEAHHLEEQATEQFGFKVGRRDMYGFLYGLSHEENQVPGGLLAAIPKVLQGLGNSTQHVLTPLIEELRAGVDAAQRRTYELFNSIEAFLQNHAEVRADSQELYDQNISLTPGLRTQPDWLAIEIAWQNFSAPFTNVLHNLERLLRTIESIAPGEDSERVELAQEIRAQLKQGSELLTNLSRILMEPASEGIYWISISGREQEITLHSAPLHVGPLLQERLFAQVDCVVLTSGTLRTANSFHFIKERLGLEDPIELALDSPFDFRTSVLLFVPNDMPEPNQPYYQRTVERAIIDLCRATEGRTLVLFTSNSQLNATYRAIRAPLEQEEIVVFAQGFDGSRRQILDNFRHTPRSVLLGTRSFWEGIDVVGQALSCLVITRLPFAVPTDPIFAARAATFADPFHEYSLPDSILRFRQGFGRLIRSKDDYGLVVVLDRRLLTKSYGKIILRSLPPCTSRQGPLEVLPSLARRWLDPANRR